MAAVDADGKATVAGYGEAAITVWYSNLVAANRIASPLPNAVDPKVFASAPRNNFIDDLVLKKLADLHIPPSPPCDDAEFIRRAYLDAAGVLPTPDETKKFLADPAPDKRAKLIDALLERPEYVDYWRTSGRTCSSSARGGCRSRPCGRSTRTCAAAWPTTSRGTASPATS